MKLSILLSAYNGENFIKEQINSLLSQTRKPDEIVLIDDFSTDKTFSIFEKLQNKYSIIKAYKNPSNLGYEKSFFYGLDHITGDIVMFCDHDDIWNKHKLQIVENFFQNNSACGFISAIDYKIQAKNKNATEFVNKNKTLHTNTIIKNKFKFDEKFILTKGEACALAVRMKFINKYKNLWINSYAHDDFWECLLIIFDKLEYYDKILVTRRIHDNNKTALIQTHKDDVIRYLNIRKHLCLKIRKSQYWQKLDYYKKTIINEYIKFSDLRINALTNKSIYSLSKIIKSYLKFYNKKAAWLRDLLWILQSFK